MNGDPDRSLDREREIFLDALERRSPGEREAFLDAACGGDTALRARLEALLRHHAEDDFLEEPAGAGDLPAGPGPVEEVGTVIGRYKLLEKIGEGGCGVVYMAEQHEPVRRRVALKVLKLGMDTRQVIARFDAERQALALMDHPYIAKVLDAGATETGRPYFVMELVRGLRITDFCDQNSLSTRDRLDLFGQVCRAVQHAHQKGIIHRDLKPANILVTMHDGVPLPKVIDFGIAKATQGRLTDQTLFTAFEQFIGTPAYMSPEQAEISGTDIDTRSDIYSLGVLLYELLTGKTPFDSKELVEAGLDQMRRMIREKEPARPSTRLSTMLAADLTAIAQRRQTEPPKLLSVVRGDLDWIVMKCLEKDRTRRYETANGLAMDLQRHLNNEPVVACPPSKLYRFKKSVNRNKLAYTAAAAVMVTLMTGLGLATWMFFGERRAHDRAMAAEREQSRLRAEEAKEKTAAQQALYDSLLGQARAMRLARRVGYRDRVFALLEQAKALDVPRKSLVDLRHEAMACLGDFIGLTPPTFTNFPSTLMPSGSAVGSACLDPSGRLGAFALDDGTIRLRGMPSGREIARLTGANELFDQLCFTSTGDQLFAVGAPAEGNIIGTEFWPKLRLYSWACDGDGRWQQTGSRALPGAGKMLRDNAEVYNVVRELSVDLPLTIKSINPGSPAERSDLHVGDEVVGFAEVPVSSFEELTNLLQEYGGQATSIIVKRGGQRVELTVTPRIDPASKRSLMGVRFGVTATFRPFNAKTGTFVAGYEVTNTLPAQWHFYYSFTPDARLLAVETVDKEHLNPSVTANLYDWKSGQRINQLHLPMPATIILSEDGRYVACFSDAGCTIYALPGLERIGHFNESAGQFPVFSGNMVALPMWQWNRIHLWNLVTREDVALLDAPDYEYPVTFTSNGASLLAIGNHHARLYRLHTPEKLELAPHAAAVPALAFSPDGARLASVGKDRTLRVYDAMTGRVVWQTNDLPGPGQCVAYSPNGLWLATGDLRTDLVCIWDTQTGQRLLELGTNSVGETWSAQFSPDGRSLAAVSQGTAAETRIWAIERSKRNEAKCGLTAKLVKTFRGAGESLLFAPDSRFLVFNWASNLYLWDFTASQLQLLSTQVVSSVGCESFTPDGRQLLTIGTNGEVLTLALPSGKRVFAFKAVNPESNQGILCLSPDGCRLAIISDSGLGVDIWNPKTGALVYSLPAERGSVFWLAWSPDSRRLAIARDNGSIAIWNLDTVGEILMQLGLSP